MSWHRFVDMLGDLCFGFISFGSEAWTALDAWGFLLWFRCVRTGVILAVHDAAAADDMVASAVLDFVLVSAGKCSGKKCQRINWSHDIQVEMQACCIRNCMSGLALYDEAQVHCPISSWTEL